MSNAKELIQISEEDLLTSFQEIYREIVIPSDIFRNIKDNNQKMSAKKRLYEAFCERVKKTNNLNINSVVIYALYKSIVENLMKEEMKSSEESLVPPNIQDDIERLKQIRNQYTKTPEEEEELDNGMHM